MICPIITPKLINFLSMPSALQLSMLVPKAADEEAVESAIKKVGNNVGCIAFAILRKSSSKKKVQY